MSAPPLLPKESSPSSTDGAIVRNDGIKATQARCSGKDRYRSATNLMKTKSRSEDDSGVDDNGDDGSDDDSDDNSDTRSYTEEEEIYRELEREHANKLRGSVATKWSAIKLWWSRGHHQTANSWRLSVDTDATQRSLEEVNGLSGQSLPASDNLGLWWHRTSSITELPRVSKLFDHLKLPNTQSWLDPRDTWYRRRSSRTQASEGSIRSVGGLEPWIKWMENAIQDLDQSQHALRKEVTSKFDAVERRVLIVEDQMADSDQNYGSLKEDVVSGEWIERIMLETLKREIPQYLALTHDPATGEIQIPDAFWDRARQVFVAREETEGRSKESPTAQQWMDFLNENERLLHRAIDDRIVVLSRMEFLNLIKSEVDAIWSSMEKRVVELMKKNNKLNTVSIFGSWVGRAWMGTKHTGDGQSSGPSPKDPPNRLGPEERHAIHELIDQALEKYAADVIAKPDYALFSAGGEVMLEMTSATYKAPKKPTLLGNLGLKYIFSPPRSFSSSLLKPASPLEVIQPGTHIGRCWAMNGTEGQVAIRLSRRIVVTEITIEHVHPRVAYERGSAPRGIEIWRLAAPIGKQRPQSKPLEQAGGLMHENGGEIMNEELDRSLENDSVDDGHDDNGEINRKGGLSPILGAWWKEGSPSSGATLLTTIEYQIPTSMQEEYRDDKTHSSQRIKAIQTFPIPLSKQNVPAFGVVIRIKSNWGNPRFTCLYRVRVHGYEASHGDTMSTSFNHRLLELEEASRRLASADFSAPRFYTSLLLENQAVPLQGSNSANDTQQSGPGWQEGDEIMADVEREEGEIFALEQMLSEKRQLLNQMQQELDGFASLSEMELMQYDSATQEEDPETNTEIAASKLEIEKLNHRIQEQRWQEKELVDMYENLVCESNELLTAQQDAEALAKEDSSPQFEELMRLYEKVTIQEGDTLILPKGVQEAYLKLERLLDGLERCQRHIVMLDVLEQISRSLVESCADPKAPEFDPPRTDRVFLIARTLQVLMEVGGTVAIQDLKDLIGREATERGGTTQLGIQAVYDLVASHLIQIDR
ncbi:hypothetical protein BX616_000811, partial [Lobosporangium transversale]